MLRRWLVYAADRAGKRVQVFTIAGKYVAQAWIDRWCEAVGEGCGNGQTAASTAFSADAEQKFLYVASRSPGRIWVFDRKTLQPLDKGSDDSIIEGDFTVVGMAPEQFGERRRWRVGIVRIVQM